jgi:hypothetical protein
LSFSFSGGLKVVARFNVVGVTRYLVRPPAGSGVAGQPEVRRGPSGLLGGRWPWQFIEITERAAVTLAAFDGGSRGVYKIVDDVPALAAEWLPY